MRRLVFIGLAWINYLVCVGQNLDRIEYFIDTEPGYGNGIDVPFAAAATVDDLTFSVPVTSLTDGIHFIYVRSRDVNGKWSVAGARPFYKVTVGSPELDRIEYFVDTDPGFGLATNVPFTPGTAVTDLAFSVSVESVSDGLHTLYIRSRDAGGKWSVVGSRLFYRLPHSSTPDLARIEYFLDTDPGYGLATNVPFSPGGGVEDLVFQVDVAGLAEGPHKIYVRSQDMDDNWSIIQIKDFSVCDQAPPVASAATSISTTGFTANWSAALGSTGYKLDVSADNFATFVSGFDDLSEPGTSRVVTGLTAGTAYKYRVRSTGSCTSVNSAAIDVSTFFTAPVATAATSVTSTGFDANWNAVSNAADYRLDVSADDFASLLPGYDNLVVATTGQSVTGLDPSATYKFRVRAVSNGSATSDNSNIISVTTLALPDAPVANAATSVTTTGFTANWSAVGGATGYRLDVSEDNFATLLAGFDDKAVASTSDAVTGLTASTSYKYRVRTEGATGTSADSNVIDVTTTPPAPDAPVANAATDVSATGFTANWTAASGASGYELDISADNFSTFVAGYSSKAVVNTTEVVTGLDGGTIYSYRVRATNVTGASVSSNVIDVTTLQTPTATPIAIAATNVGLTAFDANWLAVAGATGYQLDVSADNFSTFVAGFNSLAVAGTSTVVSGLSTSTGYKYRVRATSSAPISANSNVIDVTTLTPQMVAPVATAASEVTQSGFAANWAAAAGATGYQLDVSLDNFVNFVSGYNSLAVSGTSVAVTGLAASTTYKYRVRATGAQPVSGNSNVIDVTTSVAQMLATTATAATAVAATSFTANWTAVAGATGYELDVSTDNFVTFLSAFDGNAVTGTSEVVPGLTANTAYQYRVRATGTLPESENSNVIIVTTLQKASQTITFPVIPDKTMGDAQFAVGATASSGLTISYATASDHVTIAGGQATLVSAGRETVEASQPGDEAFNAAATLIRSFCINPAKPVLTISGANTESPILTSSASAGNQWYKDGILMPGATNKTLSVTSVGVYKVQATVDDCASTFSSDVPMIVTGTLLEHSSALVLYPNPARTKVYVDLRGFEAGKTVQMKVTDFLGRGIHKQDSEGGALLEIDVVSYAGGTYMVTLVQEARSAQLRFVKE